VDPLKKVAALEPTKKAFSLLGEFKAFALKGNVIDLAVGVIIGAAFGNIIKSLVDNILMPLIGFILPGEKGYEGWVLTIGGKTIPYGKFLGDVVNFLIVAFVLFLFIVKFLGWVMRTKKEEAAAPPLTKDQELLTEIRDLLRGSPQKPATTEATPEAVTPSAPSVPAS
jgi:large conductance mechanosensitive channel